MFPRKSLSCTVIATLLSWLAWVPVLSSLLVRTGCRVLLCIIIRIAVAHVAVVESEQVLLSSGANALLENFSGLTPLEVTHAKPAVYLEGRITGDCHTCYLYGYYYNYYRYYCSDFSSTGHCYSDFSRHCCWSGCCSCHACYFAS